MNVFNMAKRDNEIDMGVCIECNGTNFEHNSDESDSCSDCGLVRDELLIDQRPNVSYGEDGTSNEHHGRPTNEFEHESMTT